MRVRRLAVIFLGVAPLVLGEELEPGNWIMEIYHPSEPIEMVHVVVEKSEDDISLTDIDGELIFRDISLADGAIVFEHPVIEEPCRLTWESDTGGWRGTCPPGNEPEFDDGLTISLRPPKAQSPDADSLEDETDLVEPETETADESQGPGMRDQ